MRDSISAKKVSQLRDYFTKLRKPNSLNAGDILNMMSDYYCSSCDEDITDKEYEYSKENYKKILCRECQKDYGITNTKPKKIRRKKQL